MKTFKMLQVAAAVASFCAVGQSAMAAAISQSGVTIAREVISTSSTSTQTLRAPTVSFNYSNGPTANANSTQDFSVALTLGGDGNVGWAPLPAATDLYKTVNAKRQSNSSIYVVVGPTDPAPASGDPYLRLLSAEITSGSDNRTLRYYFRLENPTAAAVSFSDLAIEFNAVNATTPPTLGTEYAQVNRLYTAVNPIVGSRVGTSGTTADACANTDSRVTVRASNYIGSGSSAPEGETLGQVIVNNGYILFAQALNVQVGQGIAVNRTTNPSSSNQTFVASTVRFGDPATTGQTLGTTTSLPLGYVKFTNVPVSAFDLTAGANYYTYAPNTGGRAGDLGTPGVANTVGNVDVGSLVVEITSTNGFASGASFTLTNNPFGITGAAGAAGTNSGAAASVVTFSADGRVATVTFPHSALAAAANTDLTLLNAVGATIPAGGGNVGYDATTNPGRFYVNYIVPGNTAIPLSTFTAKATLTKDDTTEQSNVSCVGQFAGLGGGVKIDVRNFFPYNPANPGNEWVGVIRVINNDESVTADLSGQYIRGDGKYGQWGSLGNLPPRASRYFTSKEIYDALTNNAVTSAAAITDNSGAGGISSINGEALPRNTRLRISSSAASTLRVQSYIYNATTKSLVEVSASQGADFVNIESSPRDHIDQDAQTGIKR